MGPDTPVPRQSLPTAQDHVGAAEGGEAELPSQRRPQAFVSISTPPALMINCFEEARLSEEISGYKKLLLEMVKVTPWTSNVSPSQTHSELGRKTGLAHVPLRGNLELELSFSLLRIPDAEDL